MTMCATCGSENDRAATACVSCGSPIGEGGYTLPVGTKLYGGKYSVGKVLGRGSFGITYGGADTQMRRPVAIKEFFPEGSSRQGTTVYAPYTLNAHEFTDAKRAFVDEGRLLARFNHPGIVKVYDAFEDNGSAYLVMEFLRGDTLGTRLLQEGKLDTAEVIELARALLLALEEVHNQDLLHRDIKPDNVFLGEARHGKERAVLIDFGSARQFQQGKTTQLTRILTPDYAAPEQYQSAGRFGPYTDLYALAATLYHALTGDKPPPATDRMIGRGTLDFPDDAPRALVEALDAALALRVDQRPGTARALLTRLPDVRDNHFVPDTTTSTSSPASSPTPSSTPSSTPSPQPSPQPSPRPTPSPSQSLQPSERCGLGIGAIVGIILFFLQGLLGTSSTLLWGGVLGALAGAGLTVWLGRGSSQPLQQPVFVNGGVGAVVGALLLALSGGLAGFLLFAGGGAWLGYDLARVPASGWAAKLGTWLERKRDTLQRRGWLPLSSAWPTLKQQSQTLRQKAATPTGRWALAGGVAGLLFAILLTSPVGALFALALLGLGAFVGRRYAKRYTPQQSPQTATILGLIFGIPGVLLVSGLLTSPLGWAMLTALFSYGGGRIATARQQGRSWRDTVLGWVDRSVGLFRGVRNALPHR